MEVTNCNSYSHDYEYVESAYNIGKDAAAYKSIDSFIADVMNGDY